jgi:uncharacterized protein (DUF1015 family)
VASVPYDVINTEEARALVEGNADSFLHVVRPEVDLPVGVDEHADEVYAQARIGLDGLRARGVLVQEETPCLYLYKLVMNGHAQVGLVATWSVEEYDTDRILKHEHTRPDKEADRTRHVETLEAQAGPVFLTFPPIPAVTAVVDATLAGEPLFDFTAPDGIQHTVWRLDAPQAMVEAMAGVEKVYVADGHHRSAAASNVRRNRREAGRLTDDDSAHWFLAVAFPTDQVQIQAYNRLVHDLGGRSADEFLRDLSAALTVEAADSGTPAGSAEARMYLDGRWHRLALEPTRDDPVARLAPQIVQDRVLGPLLGITDPRTDSRLSFVGGIRGTDALSQAVDAGRALAAFSLPPVTPRELLDVADAGLTMPPKSTWFEPKLRSGLFTHLL